MSLTFPQFLEPRPIPSDLQEEVEFLFQNARLDPVKLDQMFEKFHAYFLSQNFSPDSIRSHFFTYWKWYVQCTWDTILSVDKGDVLALFTRQLSTAYMLEIPLQDKILYYFYRGIVDVNEINPYFLSLRQRISEDNQPLNPFVAQNSLSLRQVIVGIREIKKSSSTALHRAEFFTKVLSNLFPEKGSLVVLEPDQKRVAAEKFLTFMQFVSDTEDVLPVINTYIDNLVWGSPAETEEVDEVTRVENQIRARLVADLAGIGSSEFVEEGDLEEEGPEESPSPTAPTYAEIKAEIEANFPVDDEGQFVDIEAVLGRLQELSEHYGDEEIVDLYYFNEKSGKFEWSESVV